MSPVSHLLISWALANSAGLERRDRALVTLAGVLPDLDGLGVVADLMTEGGGRATEYFDRFHHVVAHNVLAALLLVLAALALARRRLLAAGLVLASFHLHLLADLAGSRGPDGYTWPIPYLMPFSGAWQLDWSHQWGLKAWPNTAITLPLLALALYWSWKRGRSPLELVSTRADAALSRTLRARFGEPAS